MIMYPRVLEYIYDNYKDKINVSIKMIVTYLDIVINHE